MKKLMKAFYEQRSLPPGSLRFTFDGVRIGEDSTPVDVSYLLPNTLISTHPLTSYMLSPTETSIYLEWPILVYTYN